MAQYSIGTRTFTAGEDLVAYRRVKLSGASVVYSAQGEDFIGVTETAASSGEKVTVALLGGRTHKCAASEALSAGAVIYGANSGKVSDTAVGPAVGYALEAALADGDIIEVIFDKSVGESWS